MRPCRSRLTLALTAAATVLGTVASVGTATAAAQPAGKWAPFTRCPVDAPAMLGADGLNRSPQCVVSYATSGTIKLGNTTVVTGNSNLQMGVVQNADGTSTVVAPPAGSIIADSATVPGGLIGLMCPSDVPFVTNICEQLTDGKLNKITATLESAGTPSEFNQIAGVMTDMPIVRIPVRIKLENPFLGNNCYIGTTSKPIMLHPYNADAPEFTVDRFNGADGTPNEDDGDSSRLNMLGSTQVDDTFAVPGASGCGLGLLGIIDGAVNLKTGLPSPAGENKLTLNDTQTHLGGLFAPGIVAPDAGKVLAEYWHGTAG
ncbi:hypothetical protein [Streptomyces diastaticus]|uniref:hypothetical protein n=1 Tax=Streptomyces diastaticus TaxID=1956 RepID=UPI00344DE8E6